MKLNRKQVQLLIEFIGKQPKVRVPIQITNLKKDMRKALSSSTREKISREFFESLNPHMD